MPSYRVTEFGGMSKRNGRNNNETSTASLAKDVNLWSGTLSPWRYPAKIFDTDLDKVCKLYKQGCAYITHDNPCASFTHGDTDCDRVFSTGVMPWPAYATIPQGSECGYMPELEWFRLGVPAPLGAPTITSYDAPPLPNDDTHVDSGIIPDLEPRAYAYTFVNEYGEEGPLSPMSETVLMQTQGNATIGFTVAPNPDYNFEMIRIYRAIPTAVDDSIVTEDGGNSPTSGFFIVGELLYRTGTLTYVDNRDSDQIGEMYSQECADMPLENLQNITMLGSGSLVASEGKNLWFSEPWSFHIWSCAMNFDYCIEGIKYVGDSIYVITNGVAYVVSDLTSTDECKCCRTVLEMNESTPIACKLSLVDTPTGVIFATDTGLVRINAGGMNYITLGIYSENQWGEWQPHNLTGVYHKGRYFGFNGHKSFVYHVNEGFYSDRFTSAETNFTELSLTPDAVFVTKQNELLMSFDGDIFRWDSSDTYMPYTWRSSLNVEGAQTNYSYAKIVFEDYIGRRPVPHPVVFRLYADDRVVFSRIVKDSTIFTLPRRGVTVNWYFEVEGIEQVMEVHIASTRRELTLLNNT